MSPERHAPRTRSTATTSFVSAVVVNDLWSKLLCAAFVKPCNSLASIARLSMSALKCWLFMWVVELSRRGLVGVRNSCLDVCLVLKYLCMSWVSSMCVLESGFLRVLVF